VYIIKMSQGAMIAGAFILVVCCSSSSAMLMMGGDKEKSTTPTKKTPTGPVGASLEPTNECVDSVCPSKLTSTSGACIAVTQDDGNYVVYESGTAIWDSKTTGRGTGPYRTTMQGDGNLVLYDSADTALWDSKTSGKGTGPYKAIMQDDCNFVVYDSTGSATWSSKGGITP
jgi:hypothetical protein